MITKAKLEIFEYYHFDIDAFGHGSKKHRQMMSEEEFVFLSNIIQDIKLIKNNLASKEFEIDLENKLIANCDNNETIREIRNL